MWRSFRKVNTFKLGQKVRFGSGHHGPHVPETYDKIGKACMVVAFFWIFHRLKEDKGQLFGLYQPWLEPHHHEHVHYKHTETGDGMPELEEHDHDDDDEDHDDEDDE